jgi:hypothetical protein
MEIFNFVLLVFISYFFVNRFGTVGATMAFAIVYLIYFLILTFIFRKLLFAKDIQ